MTNKFVKLSMHASLPSHRRYVLYVPSADIFYKRLAHRIANVKGLTYARVTSRI